MHRSIWHPQYSRVGCNAGPSKLPELGKVLGQTVKSFQGAAKVRLNLQETNARCQTRHQS